MAALHQQAFLLLCASNYFQIVASSSDIPEAYKSESPCPPFPRAKSFDDAQFKSSLPPSLPTRPKTHSFHSTRNFQAARVEDLNDIDADETTYNFPMDLDGDSDEFWENSSVVSENYLEEMGLRNSRSSTPSLHSPSHKSQTSAHSPSLLFLRKRPSSPESTASSSESDSEGQVFDIIDYNIQNNDDEEYLNNNTESQIQVLDNNTTETTANSGPSFIGRLPEALLSNILEYCIDDVVLDARLVSRIFKKACDDYLDLVALMTTRSTQLTFFDKFSFAKTMMPFYRRQPQIRETVSDIISIREKPWHLLSLFDASDKYPNFKNLAMFSDEFISKTLIPRLSALPQTEPPSLFLLGEALLKSKRFELFETVLLPVLNTMSLDRLIHVIVPPNVALISPGFMALNLENQVAYGATLHASINLNLRLTVYHLIEIQPELIQLKNHFGRTALLQIIHNLWKCQSPLPGPGIKENLDEWMNGITTRFLEGQSVQTEFLMDSRLLIEMFLGVMRIISRKFPSAPTAVEFMGFNDEFTVYNLLGNQFFHHRATLLQELVSAHQYDLIISIGFFYGPFIKNHPDINPLHVAAERNDPTITGLLLKFYPEINVNQLTTKSGCSAVGLAVSSKSFDVLRVLLNDPRVDPNLHKRLSPLIVSIEYCPIEMVKLLLSHPAIELHYEIKYYRKVISPVERAIFFSNWRVLELLLTSPNQKYEEDVKACRHLKEAEEILMRKDDEEDLLQLIRRVRMPTIYE